MKNLIVNLSSHQLTEAQQSLLNKGLSFCPTPLGDHKDERLKDLLLFERRVRLKSHFQYNPSPEVEDGQFHESRGWTPAKGASPSIETFFTKNTMRFLNMPCSKIYKNPSTRETTALKELMNEDTITIKSADKGVR